MLIDYPMIGNATRASWLTAMPNIFSAPADVLGVPAPNFIFYGSAAAPSDGNPWWFTVDFQEAMSLKTLNWFPYDTNGVPSPLNIYGSATGTFAGEETLIQTFTEKVGLGDQIGIPYTIDTPQSFRYYKFEIISFADTFGLKYDYWYGISFDFPAGVNAFDTEVEYIEPANKMVGDDDWTFTRRSMFGDAEDRFWSTVCMFVEDFGWEVEVVTFPTYMIVKSKGVDDNHPYMYLLIKMSATSIWPEKAYGYWDSDTKTGTLELPHNGSYYDRYEKCTFDATEAGMGVCAWGNKDLVVLNSWEKKNLSYREGGTIIGRIPADVMLRPAHTTLAALSVAGTDITLEVASSTGFEVDGYYCLWGADGEGRDFGVRVTGITDGTHIVVDNLPREYSAGSFIGTYPQTAFYYSYGLKNFGQRHKSGLIEEYGEFGNSPVADGYLDPAGALGKYILMPLIWREVDGVDPGMLALDKHFSGYFGTQAIFDVHLIGAGSPGTATGGGTKTLSDTSKTWTVDEHAGKLVYISEGTGFHECGNFVEIVSNTVDTLTVAYDWIVEPAADCTYYIADEIWQVPTNMISYSGALKCGG
jgi:hypothetical protein